MVHSYGSLFSWYTLALVSRGQNLKQLDIKPTDGATLFACLGNSEKLQIDY